MSLANRHRHELATAGVVIIPDVFEPVEWSRLARKALAADGRQLDRPAGEARPELLDAGGAYHHQVADTDAAERWVPDMVTWYLGATGWLSDLFGCSIITSPYRRSAVTIKHYGPGDEQGWHFDTNPVAVLLYLTEVPAGGELEFKADREGRARTLRPPAGSVLCMYGRELEHRVKPQPPGADRLCVVLNYYTPDDTWRPAGIDDVVYGTSPANIS